MLFRALRRKPAARVQAPKPPAGPRAPTPFEELVRRIEAAAAEAERMSAAPPPLAVSRGPATPSPSLPEARSTEFRSLEAASLEGASLESGTLEAPATEPEFHPIYDLTPEERAVHESHRVVPGPAPSAHMPSSAMPSARPLGAPPPATGRRLHPLVATLHAPEAARTAFLMKEVLGERRGARRDTLR